MIRQKGFKDARRQGDRVVWGTWMHSLPTSPSSRHIVRELGGHLTERYPAALTFPVIQ